MRRIKRLFSHAPWQAAWNHDDPRRAFGYLALAMASASAFLAAWSSPIAMVQLSSGTTTLLWLALLWGFHRGIGTAATCHWACVISLLESNITAWYSGGVYASVLAWMGVLVLASYFLVGRAAALFWTVVSITVHLLQAYSSQWLGFGPQLVGMQAAQAATSLADYSMVFVITVLVMLFYHRSDVRAFNELLKRQQQLQAKRLDLDRALADRDRFIASVSHELRTPMNAILGLSSYLKTVIDDKPGATMVLEHTHHAADHLMTIINDVLDYTQFKSGQLQAHFENVALHATLQAAFALLQPRIASSNLRYRLNIADDVPPWIWTDKHRLTQILVNLLGNAIKFTESGHVELAVRRTGTTGLIFTVLDSGIGISQEDQQRLFSRFSQANPSIQKRFGGSGLGLLISQRLVQLIGGTMGFESQQGVGSKFWFTLPLQAMSPVDAPPLPAAELAHSQSTAWRILIVDDHPINRLLLRRVLRKHWPAAQVFEAQDGGQAVDLAAAQEFDLILMDMVMAGIDGIEATRTIRAGATGAAPAILGLTANIHPPDLSSFNASGLDGVMLKPFDRELLLRKIETLLASRQPPAERAG